ncbi:MAG TPA: helix-turn-helix transcriptional regulator [Aliidongia sp.]|uniref:helix-turn-helix transcriptional regulator n=1 Tax=Aliidongia sp. TaxID=1914230 RepID=UPI002DDD4635|nr:helix-turn-helix transcriptional regulator [Aliidongia sp.]HEV2674484.1 helix-turn-helix transcriptional regulator [Aliidongia sp.]
MSKTVTLSRADYEALLDRVEDAEDMAAVALHRAREELLGPEAARANALPVELVERMMAGESPIRVWRLHRGMNQGALAAAAEVSVTYLSEIEGGKKPGSIDAMAKLARALKVTIEDLLPWEAAAAD